MTGADIERVQAYLRRILASERIKVIPPMKPGFPVEVAAGDEVIGTLHKDTDEGEISFSVHLTILDEDLPQLAKHAPFAAAAARKR